MTEIDNTLALSRAGIDTYRQPVVFMREDCHVCRAEGFAALTRIEVTLGDRSVIATLNVLTNGDWLPDDTAALSEEAWAALKPQPGDRASFTHPEPPDSVSAIRAKVYGETLEQQRFDAIIRDVLDHRLSDLDLAAFITACAGDRLSIAETIALTRSMQAAGETLDWGGAEIYDKHCVGGASRKPHHADHRFDHRGGGADDPQDLFSRDHFPRRHGRHDGGHGSRLARHPRVETRRRG